MYTPLNYEQLNVIESSYAPSMVKSMNNKVFDFWQRALFQRACSVLKFNLPDNWQGGRRDFFLYCLFRYGYVVVSELPEFGVFFQPASLTGYDFYYQPTRALIVNAALKNSLDLEIHEECELIKLTPDFIGIFDIINYYAEKLATLDNAINMSIINNKLAWLFGAKNKAAAEALKKIFDKINQGEPAVFFDKLLLNDSATKSEPWQFLERSNLKESYLTTMQLQDFNTLLNNFDSEVGIPTIPYQKKERMVTSEAESRVIDSTSRSIIWLETLESSIKLVNDKYNLSIGVELRYKPTEQEEAINEQSDINN